MAHSRSAPHSLAGRFRGAGRIVALAGAALLVAGPGAGCSGGGNKTAGATLSPQDFRRPEPPAPPPAPAPTVAAASPGATEPAPSPAPPTRPFKPVKMIAMTEAAEGVLDVSTIPGPPPVETVPPPLSSEGVIVLDAKVGEINGRPIFASAFLEPLDGRLRALAKERAGNFTAWQTEAARIIQAALEREVVDELLLAEAYAMLEPEQREYGLRVFLRQVRSDFIRRSEGSAELADARLREQEGLTIDQKAKEALERELVATVVHRHILPRVNVSARDQREYYERHFDRFNPPGTAKLRVIRVPLTDESGAESVRTALESGMSFEEAARLEANTYRRADAGLHEITVTGLYEEAEIFGITEINDAARALRPGETIGPITAANSLFWITLVSIDRPEGVDFYDAQLTISEELRNRQFREEENRYLDRLLKAGSYTNLEQTAERLLAIATERYFGRVK